MDKALYVLPALACPLGMVVMMVLMMRGARPRTSPQAPGIQTVQVDPRELTPMYKEIQRLRAMRSAVLPCVAFQQGTISAPDRST